MPISAKPPVYTVNTGHTHCPDHLWLMDEGTGTTLTDRGKTGGYNLTLTDTAAGTGPEWTTDATHGPVLDFVAANGDRAQYSSVSGLTGTQVIGVIVKGVAGAGTRTMVSVTDPSGGQLDRFVSLVYQGDEDVETTTRFDDAIQTNISSTDLTLDWDFVALRFSDTTMDWSLNGSAWATFAVSHTGFLATLTRIGLGALVHGTPTQFWDDNFCAAMWWKSDKNDTDIATIAADPWQFLTTIQNFQYQSRLNPLLRM